MVPCASHHFKLVLKKFSTLTKGIVCNLLYKSTSPGPGKTNNSYLSRDHKKQFGAPPQRGISRLRSGEVA